MDPFTIASLIAMVAGAGLQYHTTTKANKNQQQAALAAQQRQLDEQNQATQVAARKAAEFDPANRNAQQQQIQEALTGELNAQVDQPQITAQGVQVGATLPEGGATTDYLATKAREQAKATESLRGLAALMGRIGGANELRRNEAIGFGDAAGQIGRIQTGANNIFGADQVGIDAAGQPNVGAMVAGEALRGAGAYGMTRKPAAGATAYPDYGKASGPTGAWV